MPTPYSGVLNISEVYGTLRNMIISQRVYSGNIKGVAGSLVDSARVEGSLKGDTKLYISTDALPTHPWGGDAEAANLLDIDRAPDPEVQAIVLDVFRQVRVTTDDLLTKRAFMTEEVFVEFNSILIAWLSDSKKIYDGTTYGAFIGTHVTTVGKQLQEVNVSGARGNASSEIEANRLEAMEVGRHIADLLIKLKDVSTDFNDYAQVRSYGDEEIKVIWNSRWLNRFRKVDYPTIFHSEGIVDKLDEHVLPETYFGVVITSSNIASYSDATPTTGKPIDSDTGAYTPGSNNANGMILSMVEKMVEVANAAADPRAKKSKKDNKYYVHVFPGFELPVGATIVASGDFEPGEVYIKTDDVICKIVTEFPPYMSAFEVGSEFYNARSHTRNNYLTFARNTLEHLAGKPFITVKAI